MAKLYIHHRLQHILWLRLILCIDRDLLGLGLSCWFLWAIAPSQWLLRLPLLLLFQRIVPELIDFRTVLRLSLFEWCEWVWVLFVQLLLLTENCARSTIFFVQATWSILLRFIAIIDSVSFLRIWTRSPALIIVSITTVDLKVVWNDGIVRWLTSTSLSRIASLMR